MFNKQELRMGRKSVLIASAVLALSTLWTAGPVRALDDSSSPTTAPSDTTSSPSGSSFNPQVMNTITLEPGKAKAIHIDQLIKREFVPAPDIADVIAVGNNDLLITAKKSGTTQLFVWDATDHQQVWDIQVSSPIALLRKQLADLFPDSKITVEDSNGTITLTGQVHDLQTADEASQVAIAFGKVVNLLEIGGGQQVMLRVKFAEVDKTAEKELGFNFGGTDGVSFFGSNIGPNPFSITQLSPGQNIIAVPSTITGSMFGQGAAASLIFNYFVDALETNNLLRMLAEPNLVTTSGQEATFLAGGSFPYPVPQAGAGGGSTITIQFEDYGVNLKFTPIVLGNGRIRLKVAPEVSQLDYSNAVSLDGTSVPGLTKRNLNTTVELAEGQTFALGGLLQDTVTAKNIQFPILGDIPVLGALFRSVSYERDQTELVVLVTPELVHGIDPGDVTTVPGEKWKDPSALALYLNKEFGYEVPDPKVSAPEGANGQAPNFQGAAGFQGPSTTASK